MFRRSRFSLGTSSVKGVFVVLIGFAFIFAGLATAGYAIPTGYSYQDHFTVDNTAGSTLTNYVLWLTVDTTGKVKADCSDVLVSTGESGTGALSRWVDPATCGTANTIVWAKATLTGGEISNVYVSYGNSGASNSQSTSIFVLFNSLDSGGYTSTAQAPGHAGSLEITQSTDTDIKIEGTGSFYSKHGNADFGHLNLPSGSGARDSIHEFSLYKPSTSTAGTQIILGDGGAGYDYHRFSVSTTGVVSVAKPSGGEIVGSITVDAWHTFTIKLHWEGNEENSVYDLYIDGELVASGVPKSTTVNTGGIVRLSVSNGSGGGSPADWSEQYLDALRWADFTEPNEPVITNVGTTTPDTTAPSVDHTAITTATIGQDVVINADITDAVGVSSATLKYRLVGGDSFTDVSMSVTSGDTYSGTIPGSAVTADLEYYIVAVDSIPNEASSGNHTITTSAAATTTTNSGSGVTTTTTTPGSTTTLDLCGNGICEVVETNAICAVDCPIVVSEGTTTTTSPTTGDTTVKATTTTFEEVGATEDTARAAIDEVAAFIEDSRTLGASEEKISEAETVLAEAQNAFGLGDYEEAVNKTNAARAVLIDKEDDTLDEPVPGLDFTTIGVVLLVILVLGAGGIYYTMQQEKSGKKEQK